jgi:hypothetical protein
MKKFRTSDGCILERDSALPMTDRWTDGDLEFDSDKDGWPIDSSGERLEGEYVD